MNNKKLQNNNKKLQNILRDKQFQNIIKAFYSSTFNPKPEKQKEAEKWFADIKHKVNEEQVKSHKIPLFEYISEQKGLNSSQYKTFWDNYLYRTAYTVAGVLDVVRTVYLSGYTDGALHSAKNLGDELAIGKKNESHPKLLERSGNNFGKVVFGTNPSLISNVKNSSLLLPESLTDRRVRESLYNSNNPIEVFGANWIHEALAGNMLDTIYKTIYKPYQKTFDNVKQENGAFKKEIAPYFDVHLQDETHGNVEDEHMRIAQDLTFRYLSMSDNIGLAAKELESSVTAFARSQNCLWDSIQKDLEFRAKEGALIPKEYTAEENNIDIKNLQENNDGKLLTTVTADNLKDKKSNVLKKELTRNI